ncbi:hypothetical protein FOL46_001256 [Perkinsus olseni]|uniref:Uncharacterized protein n=1 Tax=Perkinsus olseni TaxID=32597 RepID=A0A7J6ME29_PEROL|nr:hypothetical protein FOL46_001256 [Perkinsus olseni]
MGICFSSEPASPPKPPEPPEKHHHHHHKHHTPTDAQGKATAKQQQQQQAGAATKAAKPVAAAESHPADHAAGGGGVADQKQSSMAAVAATRVSPSPSDKGQHSGRVSLTAKDSLALSADDDDDNERVPVPAKPRDSFTSDSEAESKAWAEHEARRERLEQRRRDREAREEQRRKNIEALNAASNYTAMDGATQRHAPPLPGGDFTPRAGSGLNRQSSALSLYADRLTSSRRYQASPRASLYAYQLSPRAAAGGLSPAPNTGRVGRYAPIYQPVLRSTQSAYTTTPRGAAGGISAAAVPLSRERSAYNTPLSARTTVAATPELGGSVLGPSSSREVTPRRGGPEDPLAAPIAPLTRQTSVEVPTTTSDLTAQRAAPSLPLEGLSRQTSAQVPRNLTATDPAVGDDEERASISSGDTSLSSSFIGLDSVTKTPVAERSPLGHGPASPKSPRRELPPLSPSTQGFRSDTHRSFTPRAAITPRAELGGGLAAAVNKKDWSGIDNLFNQRS